MNERELKQREEALKKKELMEVGKSIANKFLRNHIRDFKPCEANHKILAAYLQAKGLDFSLANLEAAFAANKDQLAPVEVVTAPATPAPPTPPAPPVVPEPPVVVAPVEELGVCSDGLPQLPLNTTPVTLKRSSVAQNKDWLKRTREATGQKYLRQSGSRATGL